MPKILLTPTIVTNTTATMGRKIDLFDTKQNGLMLEVRPTGGKTYYCRYTNTRGKTRQHKLGSANDLSLSQARLLAQNVRNKVAMGEDPSETKATLRKTPTVDAFFYDQYYPFVKSYKRSYKCDESIYRNHIQPVIGKMHLDQVTKQHIINMHHSRINSGGAPGSANRLLILLRYMFNLALKWEVSESIKNPTTYVTLIKDSNKKERYLIDNEPARLYEALKLSENTQLIHIVSALLLTGARKREILDAKWEDIDIANKRWCIPVTKAGKPRYIPINDGLVRVLSKTPTFYDCPFIFPNPKTLKPYISIYYSWNSARKMAGLRDVRMHDLRHSFASFLVNHGRSLYEVQRLLGHTQIKTTQRYAHLSEDTLLAASNTALEALGDTFSPSQALIGEFVIESAMTTQAHA